MVQCMGVGQAQIPDTIINKDSNPIVQEIIITQTNQGTYRHAMYVPFPEDYSEQNDSLRLYDQEGTLIPFILQGRTQHEYIIWCNITLKQGQNTFYLTLGNESLGREQNTSGWMYQGSIVNNRTNVTTFNSYTHLIFKQDTSETLSCRFDFNVTHYENATQYRSLTLNNKSTYFQPTGIGESQITVSQYYERGYGQHNEINIDRQNQRMTITGSSRGGSYNHVYLDAPIQAPIKQPTFMTIKFNTTETDNTVTWIGMNSSANPGTLKTEYGEDLIKEGNVLLTIYNVAWVNAPLSLVEYKQGWTSNIQNPNPISYRNYDTAVKGNSTGTYSSNITSRLAPVYQANCTISGDTFDLVGQSKMLRPTYIMNDTGKVIVLTDVNVMQLQNKTTLMPYVYDTEYIKHIYSPFILPYSSVDPAGPSQGFIVQYKGSLKPVENFTYVQSVYATGTTDSQVKVNKGASSMGVGTNLNQDVTVNITPEGSLETFDFWIQSQGVQSQTRWTILEVEDKFDIHIKVVDSETGDPINTFTTFLGEQQSIRSTDNGTVTYKDVGGGEQQVIIQADGYNQVSRGIYIQEDNQTFILRVSKIASGDQEIITPLFATFRIYNQNADLVYNQNVIIKDIDTDVELFNQTLSGTQAFTVKLDRTARYSLTVIKESSQINKTFNVSGLNDGDTYSAFVNEVFPIQKPTIEGSTDVEWDVVLQEPGYVYVDVYYKMNFQGSPRTSGGSAKLHYSSRNGGAEGDIQAYWVNILGDSTQRVRYRMTEGMYESLKQNNTTFSVSQDIMSNHTNPTTQNIYSTYYVGEGRQGLIDLGLDDEQYSYLALQLIIILTLGMATQSNVPMTIQTTCVSALFFMWLGWLVLHPFFQVLLQVGVLLSLLSIATSER